MNIAWMVFAVIVLIIMGIGVYYLVAVLQSLRDTLESIRRLIAEQQTKVHKVMENVEATTSHAETMISRVDVATGDLMAIPYVVLNLAKKLVKAIPGGQQLLQSAEESAESAQTRLNAKGGDGEIRR